MNLFKVLTGKAGKSTNIPAHHGHNNDFSMALHGSLDGGYLQGQAYLRNDPDRQPVKPAVWIGRELECNQQITDEG